MALGQQAKAPVHPVGRLGQLAGLVQRRVGVAEVQEHVGQGLAHLELTVHGPNALPQVSGLFVGLPRSIELAESKIRLAKHLNCVGLGSRVAEGVGELDHIAAGVGQPARVRGTRHRSGQRERAIEPLTQALPLGTGHAPRRFVPGTFRAHIPTQH